MTINPLDGGFSGNGKTWRCTLLASLALLSACQSSGTSSQPSADRALADYQGIAAFKAVCLETAPSFSGAKTAARQYGVTRFLSLGDGQTGSTDDDSLAVQIKPGRECAVTTPTFNGNARALRAEFIHTVKTATGAKVNWASVPFAAQLHGQRSVFTHDRRGGEAFVIVPTK